MPGVRLAALLVLALAISAAACGGGGATSPTSTSGREDAWLSMLQAQELGPAGEDITVHVEGSAPELRVVIAVAPSAQRTYTFSDGLYGAEAYTFDGQRWTRVDTADIRTEIAPLLGPGQSATVTLPVQAADSYRVVVRADGRAVWGDSV